MLFIIFASFAFATLLPRHAEMANIYVTVVVTGYACCYAKMLIISRVADTLTCYVDGIADVTEYTLSHFRHYAIFAAMLPLR